MVSPSFQTGVARCWNCEKTFEYQIVERSSDPDYDDDDD